MATDNSPHQGTNILSLSQAADPAAVRSALLNSAVRDGWIMHLVSVNAAIFFGVLLLALGYGRIESLYFLIIHMCGALIAAIVWIVLSNSGGASSRLGPRTTYWLLAFSDIILSAAWGVSLLLFFYAIYANTPELLTPQSSAASPAPAEAGALPVLERSDALVLLIAMAGLLTATLSAKLVKVLVIGRLFVFLPTFIFLFFFQPPNWHLHASSLAMSFVMTVGVGYAIHVQHLREATLNIALESTRTALERALAQERLSSARALREANFREFFLTSVAHDLRQPLGALRLFLRRLRPAKTDKTTVHDAAQNCLSSANRIIDSVAQVAWITDRLPTPQMRPAPIQPILEALAAEAAPTAEEKGLFLRVAPTSASCVTDADLLERALRNFVQNAIQYTSEGGVLLGARRRPGGVIDVVVVDTGAGVQPEKLPKIFEERARGDAPASNTGNLGIGLSIVRNIAQAIQSEIIAQSRPGHGSVFGMRLRAAANANAPQKIEAGLSALVVDDDPEAAETARAHLAALQFEVSVITDRAKIRQVGVEGPLSADLLMIDFHLDDNFTATDVLKRLSAHGPQRAIVMSRLDDPQVRGAAHLYGADFVPKPIARPALIRALQHQIAPSNHPVAPHEVDRLDAV
ncbi:MAG: ATP-binding protein [Neomegalonema sp.]|nr:ATP-binding protein [Neomegalonema sp.]